MGTCCFLTWPSTASSALQRLWPTGDEPPPSSIGIILLLAAAAIPSLPSARPVQTEHGLAARVSRSPNIDVWLRSIRGEDRTDDDSVLHLPLLEAALSSVSCLAHAYMGAFAFSGYDSRRLANCGFSWFGPAAYARYGCRERGAHPPVPFALGQLQVLSSPLVRALAASDAVNAFASTAEARAHEMFRLGNDGFEDTVLGLLLARAVEPSLPLAAALGTAGHETARASPHAIVRVNIGSRAWHNLGCMSLTGMFRQPSRSSMVVHGVRSSSAMAYVHRLLGGPRSAGEGAVTSTQDALSEDMRDTVTCLNSLNTTEAPLSRMRGWCERCVGTKGSRGAKRGLEPLPPECQFGSDGRRGSRGQPMALARASCLRHGLLRLTR